MPTHKSALSLAVQAAREGKLVYKGKKLSYFKNENLDEDKVALDIKSLPTLTSSSGRLGDYKVLKLTQAHEAELEIKLGHLLIKYQPGKDKKHQVAIYLADTAPAELLYTFDSKDFNLYLPDSLLPVGYSDYFSVFLDLINPINRHSYSTFSTPSSFSLLEDVEFASYIEKKASAIRQKLFALACEETVDKLALQREIASFEQEKKLVQNFLAGIFDDTSIQAYQKILPDNLLWSYFIQIEYQVYKATRSDKEQPDLAKYRELFDIGIKKFGYKPFFSWEKPVNQAEKVKTPVTKSQTSQNNPQPTALSRTIASPKVPISEKPMALQSSSLISKPYVSATVASSGKTTATSQAAKPTEVKNKSRLNVIQTLAKSVNTVNHNATANQRLPEKPYERNRLSQNKASSFTSSRLQASDLTLGNKPQGRSLASHHAAMFQQPRTNLAAANRPLASRKELTKQSVFTAQQVFSMIDDVSHKMQGYLDKDTATVNLLENLQKPSTLQSILNFNLNLRPVDKSWDKLKLQKRECAASCKEAIAYYIHNNTLSEHVWFYRELDGRVIDENMAVQANNLAPIDPDQIMADIRQIVAQYADEHMDISKGNNKQLQKCDLDKRFAALLAQIDQIRMMASSETNRSFNV